MQLGILCISEIYLGTTGVKPATYEMQAMQLQSYTRLGGIEYAIMSLEAALSAFCSSIWIDEEDHIVKFEFSLKTSGNMHAKFKVYLSRK